MDNKKERNRKLYIIYFFLIGIYSFACLFNLLNEFYDDSHPEIISAKVINKGVTYKPFPFYNLELVRNDNKDKIKISVLEEFYESKSIGSEISVVTKKGFLFKKWRTNIEFYEYLHKDNSVQAAFYLIVIVFLFIFFYFLFKKYSNKITSAKLTLICLFFGLIVFPILP